MMNEWISVNEKLPEYPLNEGYIVLVAGELYDEEYVAISQYKYGRWLGIDKNAVITHWLPLPEIPEVPE